MLSTISPAPPPSPPPLSLPGGISPLSRLSPAFFPLVHWRQPGLARAAGVGIEILRSGESPESGVSRGRDKSEAAAASVTVFTTATIMAEEI